MQKKKKKKSARSPPKHCGSTTTSSTCLFQRTYQTFWRILLEREAGQTSIDWCQRLLSCLNAGLIRLRSSPPPHLQGVEYVLNITAVDDNASGGPQPLSSTAQVIVGVDDVNNNKPVFEKVR